jgi:diguanylate cyclase (GGDEF)-like protein
MHQHTFPNIGDISQKRIVRCDTAISISQASDLMDKHGVSSLVIEDENNRYIFSVEDLLGFLHAGGDSSSTLNQFPLRSLSCMPATERLLVLLEFMERSPHRHVGVIDEAAKLVGIVTYTDILGAIDPAILLEKKTIGDMLSQSAPVMFTKDWILADVIHHFQKMEDAIIVVDEKKPLGIVTTKDVFKIISSGADTEKPLGEYMTSPVITTPKTTSINQALLQLKQYGIKRAIVVDEDQQLLGVITQSQLVGYAYGSWIHILRNHTSELQELVEMLQVKTQSLEVLTITDVLTGLGNRRALNQLVAEEIERISRYNAASFSVLLLDIDHFKQINDVHGHLIGDDVLKIIGKLLKNSVRLTDQATRWGGEEFSILLRNTPMFAAAEFAERIKNIIAATIFPNQIKLSVSIGVGEYIPSEGEREFFMRIDRALYRAKQSGRNRVEVDRKILEK